MINLNIKMKRTKYLLVLLLLMLFAVCTVTMAKGGGYKQLQYDIQAAGSGVQGTYLVKVAVYSKKKVSDDDIIRAAIHGVLFKGVVGTERIPTQRPLAGKATVENEHAEFFEEFFAENGNYKNFASIVPNSYTHVKAAKGKKEGATVSVMKDELRRALEDANVVRSLSSGF